MLIGNSVIEWLLDTDKKDVSKLILESGVSSSFELVHCYPTDVSSFMFHINLIQLKEIVLKVKWIYFFQFPLKAMKCSVVTEIGVRGAGLIVHWSRSY